MSPDVALLLETWETVKPSVTKQSRVELAESLVRVFSDIADLSEIEVDINEFDKVMKTAILSELELGSEEENAEYDWE